MRLTGLALTRYGSFEAERITFDPRPGVLNLLVAPNGGGKSVLRGAFCDLLFGIGGQSPMGFRYGYPGMRIMADLLGPENEPFCFGRRKGQGNTLINANGEAVSSATIERLLGRLDRSGLERLFALDTERLRKGEADLLASDGELGQALVSGAGGAHDLRTLRKSLEDARDVLAPTRRSALRPFYVALDAFVDSRKRLSGSLLRPEHWLKLQQDLAAAEQLCAEQNGIVEAESAEIARLERIRRVIPWLAAHDVAAAWLQDHLDAPALDLGLSKRLADVRAEIVMADDRLERERRRAAELEKQVNEIVVDDRVLAEATDIDRLVLASGAARKAMADLPGVQAGVKTREAEVASCLRQLGLAVPVERAGEAIPARAFVARTRRLARDFAAVRDAAGEAPRQIARRQRDLGVVDEALATLVKPDDVAEVGALVREARADGDPARRRQEIVRQREEAEGTLAAALARVPCWSAGEQPLLALRPVSPDAYERHADEVAMKRGETAARIETLQSERQACREARHRLAATASAALPDESGLHHVRMRRDSGWQLIYRRGFTADPPSADEEQAFAGPLPLPLAYERAVAAADDFADRRVREADLIAQAQAAREALTLAEATLEDAETRHRLAAETQAATERTWEQLCDPLRLGASPALREVQTFLAARERVIEARQALTNAEGMERAIDCAHAVWVRRLGLALAMPAETSLPVLLSAADKRLNEAQEVDKQRAGLHAKQEEAGKALAEARLAGQEAEAAFTKWRTGWARAMLDLGRPADEDPLVADDVLQAFADLEKAQKELPEQAERVSGMQRDNARFADEAVELVRRIAPDLTISDPFLIVAALRNRSQQAGERARQRELLREQLSEATTCAEQAASEQAERAAMRQSILVLTGAETVEVAEHRLALAADRARHAADRNEAEARLRGAGDLRSLAELRAEVASVSVDDVPARIERAAQRRQQAQAAAQEAAAAASALGQQIKQREAETGARDAAADQQSAIATMGRVLEEALVNHVAAEMLDQALAVVERESEPALLHRISALFKALTGGTYSRVQTDIGDDNLTRLVLVQHAFPEERQSVRELSEGTRDQLYLALRLAAIEEHTAKAPALPFIGDDILQTFDDDRALAAMRVLREMSANVQVILLTHHRHLLELARQLPGGSVHISRVGAAALEPA